MLKKNTTQPTKKDVKLNNEVKQSGINQPMAALAIPATIDDLVYEHIRNVILASVIPPHIEWDKVSKNQIHSRTAENYIFLLRKHFLEQFSGRLINSITTEEIQNCFIHLAQSHSNSVIIKVHFLANRMFRRARNKWGIANLFDTEDFRLPVSVRKDKKVEHYSDEELLLLLTGVEHHPILKPIINLTAATGCRIQEILNLRWKHINLCQAQAETSVNYQ